MRIGGIQGAGAQAFQTLAGSVNRQAARQTGREPMRTDTVTLSPEAKNRQRGGALQGLMEQRQSLLDQKKSLLEHAEKTGAEVGDQIKQINERLSELDAQVTAQMLEEAKTLTEQKEEKESTEPLTEEELRGRQLDRAMDLAMDMSSAEQTAAIKTKVDGEANILRSEIALDRASAMPSAGKTASRKEGRLAELEAKSDALLAKTGERLMELNKKVAEDGEDAAKASPEKEENAEEEDSPLQSPRHEEEQTG